MQINRLPPSIQNLINQMQTPPEENPQPGDVMAQLPARVATARQATALAKLTVGDSVWAEVLKSEGGNLSLKLPSGEIFSANREIAGQQNNLQNGARVNQFMPQIMPQTVDPTGVPAPRVSAPPPEIAEKQLPVGEMLQFTVLSKTNPSPAHAARGVLPRVTVALSDPKAIENLDVPKLLKAFGAPLPSPGDPAPSAAQLKENSRNIAVVREMIAGGVPADRETFQKITAALSQSPETTPKQAVFMARENIPITPQNTALFNNLLEHKNPVSERLLNVLAVLDQIPETPAPARSAPNTAQSAPQTPQTPQNTYSPPQTVSARQPEMPPVPMRESLEIPQKTELPLPAKDAAKMPEKSEISEKTAVSPPENDEKSLPALKKSIQNLFKRLDADLPREMGGVTKELARVITQLHEQIERMPEGAAKQALSQAAQSLNDTARFTGQVNNFTPVVTIPLRWGGENGGQTAAEIYVFNDTDGRKKIDPQNATVFLSLMTANAGRVETFVKVIGKSVECDFNTEMKDTADTVAAHMAELSDKLDNQGYRLARTSVKEKSEPSDLFDAAEVREENKARYFFDRKV